MKVIKVLKYKGSVVKIYHNGMPDGSFPYEYKFKSTHGWISDRTSHNSIESCLKYCKMDIDSEHT
ncbi:hypothetical protein NVP1063O_212 [Vibrio phage 1.063.O._10N.261.45.C7]|nr:hypothetical protein NVP1063O_212 [Vibrio phage 1.063.O._10N.261.45.C7]